MWRTDELRFQKIIENAPFGALIYELQSDGELLLIGANPAADQMLGLKHHKLIGKRIEEIFPSLAASEIPQAYKQIAVSGGGYAKDLFDYEDGAIRGTYKFNAFQVAEGQVGVFFTDVSVQQSTEEQLRESREELDRYFNSTLDLLCIADTDGYFKRLNPEWEKTLGYSLEELYGQRFLDFVHPEDIASTADTVSQLARQEAVLNFVNRYRCKDGSYRWIEWRSFPAGRTVYAVARDITTRVEAEEALRQSEARIKSILRAAPTGIGVVVDRVIREANDRLCEMTGYLRRELIGLWARVLYVTDEDFEYVGREKYEQIKRQGTGSVETRWRRKNGEVIDVLLSSTPLDLDDWSKGVTFTALDITGLKRAEQERIELERRVLHGQKLESLGVLAGGIAHDFNNLLTVMLGDMDLALHKVGPDSRVRANIERAMQAAHRAADLTRQMLAYSGKGRFVLKGISISSLVRENEQILRAVMARTGTLRLDLRDDVPIIHAEPAQMQQVLMNLVTNASESLEGKAGVVSCSTGVEDLDSVSLSRSRCEEKPAPGRFVYLEVTDTGCGMDQQTNERLFDPFFSTKTTGRGLGLSAVLGIVRGHRGAIFVDTGLGRGTSIRVVFPAAERATTERGEAIASEPICQSEASSETEVLGRILVVDDEDLVRGLCRDMVEALNYHAITACDGKEALEIFRREAGNIDCVILDLSMPRMDGIETLRELRKISPDIRVILSSGFNEQEATQRFVGQGLSGFLQKPYQMSELQKTLEGLFNSGNL